MNCLLLLSTLILSLPFQCAAQTWVQQPQNGNWPYSRNWNRLIYSGDGKILMELGTDACSIMTNSLWSYDPANNNFILLGAMNEDCSETLLAQNTPSWPGDRHTYSQMAYDRKRGGMWMGMGVDDVYKPNTQTCPDTGHHGPGACSFFDMWFWNSAARSWTYNQNFFGKTGPGSRMESEMEYDQRNDQVVLYGGLSGGNVASDTWIWNPASGSWKEVCGPCAPGKKEGATLVYDTVKQQVLMFGGQAVYGPPSNATVTLWYYSNGNWSQANPSGPQPPAVRFPAAAFDTRLGVLVYHAGPGQTWEYNPSSNSWTHLNISGGPSYGGVTSQSVSMAYDESTDTIVVHDFGKGNGGPASIWQLKL